MALQQMRLYVVSFELPDGKHLASFRSIDAKTDAEKKFVTREAMKALGQNPDAKLTDIEPLDPGNPHADLAERVKALKDEDPERPLAHELGLDTPNRILTDVEIPRGLAAQKTPG